MSLILIVNLLPEKSSSWNNNISSVQPDGHQLMPHKLALTLANSLQMIYILMILVITQIEECCV